MRRRVIKSLKNAKEYQKSGENENNRRRGEVFKL